MAASSPLLLIDPDLLRFLPMRYGLLVVTLNSQVISLGYFKETALWVKGFGFAVQGCPCTSAAGAMHPEGARRRDYVRRLERY